MVIIRVLIAFGKVCQMPSLILKHLKYICWCWTLLDRCWTVDGPVMDRSWTGGGGPWGRVDGAIQV